MSRLVLLSALVGLACANSPELEPAAAIVIAGSDTEIGLAQRFAEAFRDDGGSVVSVRGGGSGAGIAALLEGRIDIATSSRPLKDEERHRARTLGVRLHEHVIATDALAVIVNGQNPTSDIEMPTLASIFRGELRSWDALGWEAAPVTVYGRQSNSGTYDYFREAVLKDDYTLAMLSMNGNAQIVEAVRNDRFGIGYVGIGYIQEGSKRIKVLDIRTSTAVISPRDPTAVGSGDYPISRPLFMITRANEDPRRDAFLSYVTGSSGRHHIRAEGFVPVSAGQP